MNKLTKLLAVLLLISIFVGSFAACGIIGNEPENKAEFVDYVSKLKLDMNSETLKQEVTIYAHIDGDTTHFNVPTSVVETGVLKARYLAINTPESTGKIEPWGKKASVFTKEKLMNAESIIIESDDNKWNIDSTGERRLVWVWYRNSADEDYRNLNLEILQNGLAISSNSAANRYGQYCVDAIAQALANEFYVYSKDVDPDYPYGGPISLTLRELRCNIEKYDGQKVSFTGVVTKNNDGSIYVEDYDDETGMYYGMTVYYANAGLDSYGLKVLETGNEVRIVGIVTYWETGTTYQVASLTYNRRDPENLNHIKKLSEGHAPSYLEVSAKDFAEGKVTVELAGEEVKTFDFADLTIYTSISMKNLKVKSIYTTSKEGSSKGAMTLTCESEGVTVTIRTIVLKDADGNIVTASQLQGKTIDIVGFVEQYDGEAQIKVFSIDDITIR